VVIMHFVRIDAVCRDPEVKADLSISAGSIAGSAVSATSAVMECPTPGR